MSTQQRRSREKDQRKRQILAAARRLLLEKGLHGVSVNQIAQAAELGVGTLYFYYAGKEAIFAGLQVEGLDRLQRRIRKACADGTAEQRLKAAARAYWNFSQTHREYYDIISYFLSVPVTLFPPPIKQRIDRCGRRILDAIAAVVDQGRAQGCFGAADSFRAAVMFWAMLHGLMQFGKLEATVMEGIGPQQMMDFAVERFIEALKEKPNG